MTSGFTEYSRSDGRVRRVVEKGSFQKSHVKLYYYYIFAYETDFGVSRPFQGKGRFKTAVWSGRSHVRYERISGKEQNVWRSNQIRFETFAFSSSKLLTVRCAYPPLEPRYSSARRRADRPLYAHARGKSPRTYGRPKSTHYLRHRNKKQRFYRRHRHVVVIVSSSYFPRTSARTKAFFLNNLHLPLWLSPIFFLNILPCFAALCFLNIIFQRNTIYSFLK